MRSVGLRVDLALAFQYHSAEDVCITPLLGQGCCHAGPAAAVTASVLQNYFQYFFIFFLSHTEVLKLICTVFCSRIDHGSQRNASVLARNCETKVSMQS